MLKGKSTHYLCFSGSFVCPEEPDLGSDLGVTSHEYNWETASNLYLTSLTLDCGLGRVFNTSSLARTRTNTCGFRRHGDKTVHWKYNATNRLPVCKGNGIWGIQG